MIGDFWLTVMYARPKNSTVVILLIRSANLRIRNKVAGPFFGLREMRANVRPACGDSDMPPTLGYAALLTQLLPCLRNVFAQVSF